MKARSCDTNDEGAGILGKARLQSLHCREIEVVGGLVEQEQVGLAHQNLGQLQPAALAAGQCGHRPDEISLRQSHVLGELANPCFQVIAALHAVAFLQITVALQLRLGSLGQPCFQALQLIVQGLHIGEGLQQGVEHAAFSPELVRLAEVGHGLSTQDAHVSRVRLQLAREQLEYGGLARAVGAEQGKPIAWPDEQRGAGQDLGARIAEMCVGELGEAQPLAFMNSRMWSARAWHPSTGMPL